MAFEADLRTFLLADAAISALVGTRAYPGFMVQQSNLPALTYQRLNTDRDRSHDGPDKIQRALMRISCWSETVIQARDLANKVRLRLDGFRGVMGAGTTVQASFSIGDRDDFEPEIDAFVSDLDYEIWAEEI